MKAVARRRRSRRRRRGGGGALVAPGNWEPGQGRTTLAYRGVEVIDAPVVIGESEPIVLDGRADSVLVEITYLDGVPVEGQELLGLA